MIIDHRIDKKKIGPSESWIPAGIINTLLSIRDEQGNVIGDIEIGSDGFIQMIWDIGDVHYRLERYPSMTEAIMSVYS